MQSARTTGPRGGFTLIELLVVILIISLLAVFILGAVTNIRLWMPRVQARSDITNLEGAMAQFKQDFQVDHLPSDFVLREDVYDTNITAHRKAVGYLTKLFGRNVFRQTGTPGVVQCGSAGTGIDWNGNGSIQSGDLHLTGEQCLVFFLGGIPSTSGGNRATGFSKDAGNPAAPGGLRHGPFFQFKAGRLFDGATTTPALGAPGFFVFRDPYERPSGTFTYYAYFAKGLGAQYDAYSIVANYYRDSAGQPINPTGYQILCAGQDGAFGSTPTQPGAWTSSGTSLGEGKDDQANFTSGMLGGGSN